MRGARLSASERRLMNAGHAIVAHCEDCDSEYFLAKLPMDARDMARAARRFKCPTDPKHRLFMGPIKARRVE